MKKINKLIEKYKEKNGNDKKKIENLIFLLLMLIVLVIGINSIFGSDKTNVNTSSLNTFENENVSNNNIEEKLEKILSKVKGVTNVSVMITYESNKQIVPLYNLEEKEIKTEEIDSNGGKRDTIQKDYLKEIIFEQNNNNSTVVIEKQIEPNIAGVIVVANYGEDIILKQEIIAAVATATNISQYKVEVLSSN